jgi:iron complex transport system permease protein
VPAQDVFKTLARQSISQTNERILWQLRFPRVLLSALVGMGLATAGAGYQGLFRNPLADPYVIGASSGSAFGAILAILYLPDQMALGLTSVTLAAFGGAVLAVAIVFAIAGTLTPTVNLLLAGFAVSSFLGAVVSLLMFANSKDLPTIFGWMLGGISNQGWSMLAVAAPMALAGSLGLWLFSRPLDALTFGEESAGSLGLDIQRLRLVLVGFASITTAAAVAASGIIGFVGLIAPHVARSLVGARHGWLIPASGLVGATLVVAADALARVVVAPAELPAGVLTSLVGGPFFLYLLKTRNRAPWLAG